VSIRNAYGTIANNVLNQRMKTLTMLTLLIALPNVFYGMYGMNVDLPFQHEPWLYIVIVVFTLALILIVYWVAKRRHVF
jgi:magnesium transporter